MFCSIDPASFYIAARTARAAPIAPAKDPADAAAPLTETVDGVDVLLDDPVALEVVVVLMVAVETVELLPVEPPDDALAVVVGAGADDETTLPPPIPLPTVGDSPPVATFEVPVAAVERDEAELDRAEAEEEEAPELEVEVAEAEVLELEETAEQDRSKSGVSLKVLPTIPKLGLGVTGAASWRVNHHVLTLPKRVAHPTASQ